MPQFLCGLIGYWFGRAFCATFEARYVALKVAVPSPVEPLPKPTDGGGYQTTPSTPDILVRIDMTERRTYSRARLIFGRLP